MSSPEQAARSPHAQVAIFDFDGTIVDSLERTITEYNRLAPRFRVRPIDRADLPRLRSLNPQAAMREYGVTLWKLPLIVRSMRRALHGHVEALQAFPGMPEALRALAARGVRLGILSSNSTRNIELFLSRSELQVFEHVEGGSSMFGKARALRSLMRTAKLDPRAVLYVGDEVRDLDAARAAGVRSVAVSWGYGGPHALAAARPTHLIEHPEQLVTLLS
jgi:phosphoglycolate phosphatase